MNQRLFFTEPANTFEHAFVQGNGRIGVTVYGDVQHERLNLNEDTFWSGTPSDCSRPDSYTVLEKAKQMIESGLYTQAQQSLEQDFQSKMSAYYLPVADLLIDFKNQQHATEYKRFLLLDQAASYITYTCDTVDYTREAFVSAVDQVAALRFSASKPNMLNLSIGFSTFMRHRIWTDEQSCHVRVEAPEEISHDFEQPDLDKAYCYKEVPEGIEALVSVFVRVSGGKIESRDDKLLVVDATQAELIVAINTSFNGWQKHPRLEGKNVAVLNQNQIECARQFSFDQLFSRHLLDYQKHYLRFAFSLGSDIAVEVPTDKRLQNFSQSEQHTCDVGMVSLMCAYARYLALSCTREKTQPACLQGIWNHRKRAPWRSGYTTNINLQMNYWPLAQTGLADCVMPMVDLLSECAEASKLTSRRHYQSDGAVLHHNTDLWRITWPMGGGRKGSAVFGFWPLGGVWLCRTLWELYEYTLDKDLLEQKLFPIILKYAQFALDILSKAPDGSLWVSPATSPENHFMLSDGTRSAVAKTATASNALVRDIFEICIQAEKILQTGNPLVSKMQDCVVHIAGYQIGSHGEILEWDTDCQEADIHHRHISHLYGLFPAQQITPVSTPNLAQAAKVTLDRRGDDGPGWCLSWKACTWARLGDGERAWKILMRQLAFTTQSEMAFSSTSGTYPNLLCAHPPFQIDGNFGFLAAVLEMILYSTDNYIHLLPALPDAWADGQVEGLFARGGVQVTMQWKNKEVVRCALCSEKGYTGTLMVNGIEQSLVLQPKKTELVKVK